MLILLSGPDRVGKSTLAAELSELSGFSVKHHSAPDSQSSSIFEVYRNNLRDGESQIWDRSYVCAYILERFRKRTHDHIVEIMDLEFELSQKHRVIHVGVTKPWHWSAPLHYNELKEENPEASWWHIRDQFMARQSEHHFYTDEMAQFFQYGTMFPSFMVEPSWSSFDVWSNIEAINGMERPRFTTA